MKNKTTGRMYRKGLISVSYISWIPRIIFLIVVMVSVIMLIRAFAIVDSEVGEAEMRILAERLMFSPEGIAYADEDTGRVYPGVIDLEKINPEREGGLMEHIYYGEKSRQIAAKITIDDMETRRETFIFNRYGWERLEPVAYTGAGVTYGKGGVSGISVERPVLGREKDGKMIPMMAKIWVLRSVS